MPPKKSNKNGHGGARKNSGRKKGSRNQPKGQLSIKTKPGAMLKYLNDTRKKGPEVITVEAAREKRAAAEEPAIEQQERDRQKREDQRKEEQEKEKERQQIIEEERKKNEKTAAEALALFQDYVEASIGNNNATGGSGGGDGDGGDGGDDDDDDDYEDHDDIADLNPDENYDGDEENSDAHSRASCRYKPPLDSDLGQYLEGKKSEITKPIQLSLYANAGMCWFPPTESATEDIEVKTSRFCEEQAWIYLFYPFGSRLLKTKKVKDLECVCCGEVGKLEFNGWHYRPQTWFDKTVWLLHRPMRKNDSVRIVNCDGNDHVHVQKGQYYSLDVNGKKRPLPITHRTSIKGVDFSHWRTSDYVERLTVAVRFDKMNGAAPEVERAVKRCRQSDILPAIPRPPRVVAGKIFNYYPDNGGNPITVKVIRVSNNVVTAEPFDFEAMPEPFIELTKEQAIDFMQRQLQQHCVPNGT